MVSPWLPRMEDLVARGLDRVPRVIAGRVGREVATADGPKLLFCSNDYLGLAADPRLGEAMARAAQSLGAGLVSSRLVSGNSESHRSFEGELARFLDTERAVIFPSGYQANVGALVALANGGDTIFSDSLNHASIIDACRLSRATTEIYRHADPEDLAERLRTTPTGRGLKLVVTEAVFSMDGDLAPLVDLAAVAARHDAALYVDEAHAFGVLGPGGRGLTAALGLGERTAVRMGTLGKAVGVAGAFVALDGIAARVVESQARALLYTTAQPAPLIEAARRALELVAAADDRRAHLVALVARFRELAASAGLPVVASTTPIQPVLVGGARRAVAVSEELWRRGVFVQAIRPPTVPEGTSRLRITLSAAHREEDLDVLVRELAAALALFPARSDP